MTDSSPNPGPQNEPPPEDQAPQDREPISDAAGQSLADALRVSFRLLRWIMIAVVIAFLATGLDSIEEQQVGILKVFGKVVGTAEPGLAFNWPFPVGSIEVVDVRERTLEIPDFWMHVKPRYQHLDISELPVPRGGLKPGADGALFCGDRNLIHVDLSCTYAIREPIPYRRNITDVEEVIRSFVCVSAIEEGASRTAESIRTDPLSFVEDVRRDTQRRMDELLDVAPGRPRALTINAIVLNNRTWPLRARPAYEAAQRASQEMKEIIDKAIADAKETLTGAAGVSYRQLVGEPWGTADVGPLATDTEAEATGLIDRYDQAKARDDETAAREILREIDAVLVSRETGGEASRIISEAQAYKTALTQAVSARATRFRLLLPKFRDDPQFMLNREWADVKESVLSAPTMEKYFITLGKGKTVLRIRRDPEVVREIMEAKLKAKKESDQTSP